MKCLIVEDDFFSRNLLQKIFSKYGASDVATNGKEAISAFLDAHIDKSPYDMICMDIGMPEMDGQEALLMIRKIEKTKGLPSINEVKVLMVTSSEDPHDVVDAYRYGGCTDYLSKPITEEKIVEKLLKNNLMGND